MDKNQKRIQDLESENKTLKNEIEAIKDISLVGDGKTIREKLQE